MPATKDQRTGAVKYIRDLGQPLGLCQQRQTQQQDGEQRQTAKGHALCRAAQGDGGAVMRISDPRDQGDSRPGKDGADLRHSAEGHQRQDEHRKQGYGATGQIGCQLARHPPDGISHHRDGGDLQPRDQPASPAGAGRRRPDPRGQRDHDDRRWQGKAQRRHHRAGRPTALPAQCKGRLGRGRAGQKLAERQDLGIGFVADPLPALDQFFAEIAQMGDRAAETCQAKFQKRHKNLEQLVVALHAGVPMLSRRGAARAPLTSAGCHSSQGHAIHSSAAVFFALYCGQTRANRAKQRQ